MTAVAPHSAETSQPFRETKAAIALVAAFTLVYLIVSILKAEQAPLWVDEVFTLWMLDRVPSHQLWDAIALGTDAQPPTYYLLLKGVRVVLGNGGYLSIRLPSLLGFLVFQLSIFVLLKKRFPARVAAVGMTLPALTQAGDCATWARPYGILAGCFGLAVLLWDSDRPSVRRAGGLWLALAAAMLMHFYAGLLVVTFGAMELLWSRRHRRIRLSYWIALVFAIGPALIWLPLLRPLTRQLTYGSATPQYFAPPSVGALIAQLYSLICTPCICLLAFAVVCVWLLSGAQPRGKRESSRDLDLIAFGCLLLPVLTLLFADLITHTFTARYFFESAMITSVVVAVLLARWPVSVEASMVLVSTAAVLLLTRLSIGEDARTFLLSKASEPLPIVTANGSDFFELTESVQPSLRKRLAFTATPPGVTLLDPSAESIAASWKHFDPSIRFFPLKAFLGESPRFYVLCTGGPDTLTPWLVSHGPLSLVAYRGNAALFLRGS